MKPITTEGGKWIRVIDRLPGLRQSVKWRWKSMEIRIRDVVYLIMEESPRNWEQYEWLDENPNNNETKT